jgi:predicted DNA repair protein MutK
MPAEIIVIALGTVAAAPLATRIGVLVALALRMTVRVRGLVAAIVKLDDAGLALSRHAGDGEAPRWSALAGGRCCVRLPG